MQFIVPFMGMFGGGPSMFAGNPPPWGLQGFMGTQFIEFMEYVGVMVGLMVFTLLIALLTESEYNFWDNIVIITGYSQACNRLPTHRNTD